MKTQEKVKTTLYKIVNTLNEKLYIGISCNTKARWSQHKRKAKTLSKTSYAIHFAMHKYGITNFEFNELSYHETWEDACIAEIALIAQLKNDGYQLYNETDCGEGHLGKMGPLNLTPEQRQARSDRHKGEKNYFYGKKLSGEANGNYGKPMKQHVKDILLSHKRKLSDEQIEEIKKLFAEGQTQTALSEQFHVSLTAIHQLVKGKRWTKEAPPPTKPRLTVEQVKDIKRLYATGNYTYEQLKEKFSISIAQISRIINGIKWKHVTA